MDPVSETFTSTGSSASGIIFSMAPVSGSTTASELPSGPTPESSARTSRWRALSDAMATAGIVSAKPETPVPEAGVAVNAAWASTGIVARSAEWIVMRWVTLS